MAQVIEKTNVIHQQHRSTSTLGLDLKSPASTTEVNQWIRSLKKWIHVLEQWKKEAHLIDRLVNMSVLGEDFKNMKLVKLQSSLRSFINEEVKEMEVQVLDLQQNIDLLQRCVINSGERMNQTKKKIQDLSKTYGALKHELLHELANDYPVRFH
ncbi:MAG: hypothetical protein HKN76_20375 [Saprospiraceae bacterium]|nr:hypothetical protein [Saprospiraceae bacterium]